MSFIKFIFTCIIIILFNSCFFSAEKDVFTTTFENDKLQRDLFILKGIVQKAHAGAYAYNTPAQIDLLFDSVNKTIDDPLTLREFYQKVDYILDRLGCIHSATSLPDEYYDSIKNKPMFFPIPLIVIDNDIYINSTAFTIPLGSEVLKINNIPARSLMKTLGTYEHTDGYSNGMRRSAIDDDFAINFFLAYGNYNSFELQYVDTATGIIETTSIKGEKLKDIYDNMYDDTWYFFPGDPGYDFELLDDKVTAILTIRSFSYKTYSSSTALKHFIDNSFTLIKQNGIRNLIIDCRNNGGGTYDNTYPLLCYLLNDPIKEYDSAIRRFNSLPFIEYIAAEDTSRIIQEDSSWKYFTEIREGIYTKDQDEITEWEPNDFVFKGRLYVIINPGVASAASNFAAILKDRTNAFFVGEETGGNNAAHNAFVFTYELPNTHLKVAIPTRRYYQPVSQKNKVNGVIPDKYIPLTLRDLKESNDKPLNYILDTLIRRK